MSAVAAFVRSWSAGVFTATLSAARVHGSSTPSVVIEWAPRQPSQLTAIELAEYRVGRNRALADLSAEIGLTATVIEL